MTYQTIRAKLAAGQPVILDGPMNTELVRRGVRWRKHGLLTDTVEVERVHREYIEAGADVIRTNTFQLNPLTYLNVFRSPEHQAHIGAPGLADLVPQLLRTAVRLARQARTKAMKTETVALAGVLSPLQHCYRPDMAPPEDDARRTHYEMARTFAELGVDFLFCECMNRIREARAALAAARSTGLPVWVSFVPGPEGELLSGEPLAEAAREMEKGGAEAVLISNCPLEDVTRAIPKLKTATQLPIGGFAHVGKFSPPSWKFDFFPQFIETDSCPPERYVSEARRWRQAGASILGSDCGTGPAHTAALVSALQSLARSA
jgi:S-methylmethionine-dependent homocysteine/selenocysteine methylase